MDIQKITKKIRSIINEIAPEAEAFLYGSQARGDAREDSDVDILILLPDSYTSEDFVNAKLDISGRLYDLSLANDIDISPLIIVRNLFYARKTPFTINVINEGITI
jgi:predicted nucleotidyltransferase